MPSCEGFELEYESSGEQQKVYSWRKATLAIVVKIGWRNQDCNQEHALGGCYDHPDADCLGLDFGAAVEYLECGTEKPC